MQDRSEQETYRETDRKRTHTHAMSGESWQCASTTGCARVLCWHVHAQQMCSHLTGTAEGRLWCCNLQHRMAYCWAVAVCRRKHTVSVQHCARMGPFVNVKTSQMLSNYSLSGSCGTGRLVGSAQTAGGQLRKIAHVHMGVSRRQLSTAGWMRLGRMDERLDVRGWALNTCTQCWHAAATHFCATMTGLVACMRDTHKRVRQLAEPCMCLTSGHMVEL